MARGEAHVEHDGWVTRQIVYVACRGVDEQDLPVRPDAVTCDTNIGFNDQLDVFIIYHYLQKSRCGCQ